MTARWNVRSTAYLVLAHVGLILSLTIDILVAATASAVFMVIESRRIAMRRVWIYIVLIPLVALAFALPLFLAMRERHLATREIERSASEAGAA